MSRNFDYCVQRVLGAEGGFSNNARDPGGRTNHGITAATLTEAHKSVPGLPATVDALTEADALRIYQALYWQPIRGDALPLPLALLTFDAAVNQGVGTATKMLQWALGVVVDGAMGPGTLAAAQIQNRKAISELAARRMYHYMLQDAIDDTFGLGWSRRLCRMHEAALAAPDAA